MDKRRDYEGLCGGSRGRAGRGRPVICEAERKLVKADLSCLLTVWGGGHLKEIKALRVKRI